MTPKRLDYAVKWRFFRHLITGADPDSERVYRWHINERTGGNEPGSPKNSVDDYVWACDALLASIRLNGFDPAHLVKIGTDGAIVGTGAHRISCCLALDAKIAIKRVDRGAKNTWGLEWFHNHGARGDDIIRIVTDWTSLRGER